MMNVSTALVIQPDPTEAPGLVGTALRRRGFHLDSFVVQDEPGRPVGRADPPPLKDYDLAVITGSPWSVYDEEVRHWVEPLLECVADAHAAGTRIFGICFGAQILATALGGSVARGLRAEIGYIDVVSSVEPCAGPWFEWHHDAIDAPSSSTVFAATDVGCQVFADGRSVGVQFHPEVDVALLTAWTKDGVDREFESAGTSVSEVLRQAATRERHAPEAAGHLLDWVLDRRPR